MHIYDSFRGKNDCLMPIMPYLTGLFNYLGIHGKIPPKVRAMDIRHILIMLPFLLDGLLVDAVLKHSRAHPLNPALGPSSELIRITMMLIQLSRRRYPPNDEVDIQDLTNLGERCSAYCIYLTYFEYFTYCAYFKYLEQCRIVFPYINGNRNPKWPQERILPWSIPPEMLHDMVMQSIYVVTPPRRPTIAGSKNKLSARINQGASSTVGYDHVWCCTPCAKKQVHYCVL